MPPSSAHPETPLTRLALARGAIDRAAQHRARALGEILEAFGRPETPQPLVVWVAGDRLLVVDGPGGLPELLLSEPPARAGTDLDLPIVFLGDGPIDSPGAGPSEGPSEGPARRYVAILAGHQPDGAPDPTGPWGERAASGRWAGLREVGALLGDDEAGVATSAVSLAHWHATHRYCPSCGALTEISSAGWSRRCLGCGIEHFPRTDPAVITTVVDDADRVLLGRQHSWPEGRFSALAGFVEAGESLEAAVRREVFEEAGVQVGAVQYLASQPWPFPRSLMLGFTARALSTEISLVDDELAQAAWYSREELAREIAAGTLLLPPSVSIAHRLIEHWYGAPLEDPSSWLPPTERA